MWDSGWYYFYKSQPDKMLPMTSQALLKIISNQFLKFWWLKLHNQAHVKSIRLPSSHMPILA